jgi:hypothetical protein
MKKTILFLLIGFSIQLFAQPELPFETKQGYFDGMAIVAKNNKFGYVDKGNRVVVPIIYDQAKAYSHGRALVTLNGKSGIIDKQGKIIVPLEYSTVGYLGNEDNQDTTVLQAFTNGNSKEGCCFYDYSGLRICPQIANVSCDKMVITKTQGELISFHYTKVQVDKEGDETVENFYGICTKTGKIVVQPLYREIQFYDHIIYAKARSYSELSSVFDLNGSEILKVKWIELKNGFFEYTKMDQSKGKITLDGKLI